MDDQEGAALLARAQALHVQGDREGARAVYGDLWAHAIGGRSPYWACVAAHFLAHAHDAPEAQRDWHLRALQAAIGAADPRVRTFYPSLYANLADVSLRLDDLAAARHYAALAREEVAALPDDAYGASVRALLARVTAALGE